MTDSRLEHIGRWIAVFPAALISALSVRWIVLLIHSDPEHTLPGIHVRTLEYSLVAFFLPLTFVLVGTAVAPRHKFKSGIVLACLWVVLAIGSSVLSTRLGSQIVWSTVPLSSMLALAALIIALIKVRRDEKPALLN